MVFRLPAAAAHHGKGIERRRKYDGKNGDALAGGAQAAERDPAAVRRPAQSGHHRGPVEILYHVFFSPAGYLRLYTPNLGVALVITILMVIHWGMDCFDFWPFSRRFLKETNPLLKGIILLLFYTGIGLLVMFVLYNEVIGRLGPIFFSGPALLAGGGLGQYAQTAAGERLLCPDHDEHLHHLLHHPVADRLRVCALGKIGKAASGPSRSGSWGCFWRSSPSPFCSIRTSPISSYPAQIFMAALPWWSGVGHDHEQPVPLRLDGSGPRAPVLDEHVLGGETLFPDREHLVCGESSRSVVGHRAGIVIMSLSNRIMDWYFGTEAFEGGADWNSPPGAGTMSPRSSCTWRPQGRFSTTTSTTGPEARPAVRALIRTLIAVAGGLLIVALLRAGADLPRDGCRIGPGK